MVIEWSESLSTGLDWQDRQHKELFKRMSSLMDAMNVGLGRDEVMKLFRFLDDYFVVHFDDEEQVMNKFNYPGSLKHIEQHTRFIDDIAVLRAEASEKGLSASVVILVQRRVVDWLINHIGETDREFAAFVSGVETEQGARIPDPGH
jgi:hemerythrin